MKLPNLNIFKDLRIKYTWLATVGVFLIIAIFCFALKKIVLGILLTFIWYIAVPIFFDIIKNKRINKIQKYLDDCHARIFVNTILSINETAKQNNDYIKFWLAAGYIPLGEFEQAYSLLKSINIKSSKNIAILSHTIIYYNNLLVVCNILERYDEAKLVLEKMKEILDLPCVINNTVYSNLFQKIYTTCSLNYKESIGEIEPNIDLHKTLLETDSTLSLKVSRSFRIAEAYLKQDDTENAKVYYDFVIKNGGDFWHVAAAKEKMTKIEAIK